MRDRRYYLGLKVPFVVNGVTIGCIVYAIDSTCDYLGIKGMGWLPYEYFFFLGRCGFFFLWELFLNSGISS